MAQPTQREKLNMTPPAITAFKPRSPNKANCQVAQTNRLKLDKHSLRTD